MAEIGQEVYFIGGCLKYGIQKKTITSFGFGGPRHIAVYLDHVRRFHLIGKDVFETEAEAREAAEKMKKKEIVKLTKRIERLHKLHFVQENIDYIIESRVIKQRLKMISYETYDDYVLIHVCHQDSRAEDLLIYHIKRLVDLNNKIYQAVPTTLKDLPRHVFLYTRRTFPSFGLTRESQYV